MAAKSIDRCSSCKVDFDETNCYRGRPGAKQKYNSHYCKPCHKIKAKGFRSRNPMAQRAYHRMSRYSLSLGDIEKIREQIGDKCEICGVGFVNGKFDIDHNHTSGEVRGFLCHNCNMVLGFARDNQTILRNAISYLDKNSDVIPCATPQKAASI